MSKYIKMLALTFVTMAFVLPANAKVINLYDMEEYEFFGSKELKDKKDEAAQKCSSSELSASEKGDLTCTGVRTLKNGVKCYKNCSCSKDLYPYSSEECSGAFEGFSDVCSYGGNVRYKDCKCKSPDYTNISSSDLAKYSTYFNISSAKKEIKKNNKTITCYKIADFTCKSGYSSISSSEISGEPSGSGVLVTVKSKDEPLRYNVAKAGKKMCVYGVASLSDGVYANRPSSDCGETGSKTANKFSYTYYYYTGCSTSGNCIATSTQECVNVSSDSITVFNTSNQSTSSKTCYKVTGCKTGWNGNVFCDTDKSVATGISRETKGKGTITCMSVSCAQNYTTYASGTGSSSTINTSKTTAQTWHSVGVHQTGSGSSIGYLICAKPNCPSNSTYNTTSKTCACNTGYMMGSDNKCYLGADHCAKQNKIYQNGQCVACASGKVFNPTTKTCRDECKAHSTWNGTTCACDSGYNKDASGNCIACSGGKTWNGTACVCSEGYTEDASGNCVKEDNNGCPQYYSMKTTKGKFSCATNQYYSGSGTSCSSTANDNHYFIYYVSQDKTVIRGYKKAQLKDGKFAIAQVYEQARANAFNMCNSSVLSAGEYTGMHNPLDYASQAKCVIVSEGHAYSVEQTKKIESGSWTAETLANKGYPECVESGNIKLKPYCKYEFTSRYESKCEFDGCPSGYNQRTFNGTQTCDCPFESSEKTVNGTKTCVCNDGYEKVKVNNTWACKEKCPTGSSRDLTTGECVSEQIECPEYQEWNGASCVCKDGYQYYAPTSACVYCPFGNIDVTKPEEDSCVVEGDCPDGYEMDIWGECIPIDDGVDLTPPDDRDIGNGNEVLWVDDEDLPGSVDCSPPCRRKQYMGKKYCDCNP